MSGTCVTVTLEGRRPLLAEVQALVTPSPMSSPRRAVSGIDSQRLAMLLAVLQRRVGLAVQACDVYAATVGGASLAARRATWRRRSQSPAHHECSRFPRAPWPSARSGWPASCGRSLTSDNGSPRQRRLGLHPRGHPEPPACPLGGLPSIDGMTLVECTDLHRALTVLGIRHEAPGRGEPGVPADLQIV